ncbi:MAG: hypothetical protein QNJ46_13705 [Leptolyngbyaceae cyanobacterium MO_188.B28]|nr:hypothetical protein [Leptolyngbyaceae cyanobacterium MO_188.B28]
MSSFSEQIKAIYTTNLSSDFAEKFCDDRSKIHYSAVQLPFGRTWIGSEEAAEYVRRLHATFDVREMEFEVENYDESYSTFTVKTTLTGQWKQTGKLASFSERHFGELRGNKIRQLTIIALDVDEMLSGFFTRAESLFNTSKLSSGQSEFHTPSQSPKPCARTELRVTDQR